MLNAAASLPDAEQMRHKIASGLTDDALAFIQPLCSKLGENAMKRFFKQISLPAVSFASCLQRSASRYYLTFGPEGSMMPRLPLVSADDKTRTVYVTDIRRFQLVDFDTRRTLRVDQRISANKSGMIGEQVLPIHPTICRSVGKERYVSLGKARVLVKLHDPLLRPSQSRLDGNRLLAGAANMFRST